jgi:hypothetical protein
MGPPERELMSLEMVELRFQQNQWHLEGSEPPDGMVELPIHAELVAV